MCKSMIHRSVPSEDAGTRDVSRFAGWLSIWLQGAIAFALAISIILCPVRVDGQTFAASITGVVTDQSGAVVPNANVTILNDGTNEQRKLTSDANGRFTANQLMPGTYSLTVKASGFTNFVEHDIQLSGNKSAEHNATLHLGASDQVVEVNASTVSIDTQTANREITLDSQAVLSLPTSYRNPLFLVHSTAGVVAVRTGMNPFSTDQNQNRFSLNGGRDESASILVDGASIVAPDLGGAIATPTMDASAEVQVQRTAYDAQFTHTDGGVVSIITKGGTNTFHGSAFEYLRNDHLDANSWDNNHFGIARPLFQRNQFGGSLGGPILRNKLFLFGSYEGFRQGQPQTYVTTVPTALERTGDFSQSVYSDGTPVTIYNPFNVVNGQRQKFAGNKIPSNLLNPVGTAAVALYPLPNTAAGVSGGNNYAASAKVVAIYDKFDVRGDYILNSKNTMFGRLTKAWQLNSIPVYFHNPGDNQQGENDYRYAIILGETWTASPTWVVNTIVSYGKWTEEDTTPSLGHSSTELGIPQATAALFQANAYPQFNIENFAQLGYSQYANTPHETDGLQVNISHQMHAHSLKMGFLGELQRLYPANISSANFSFNSGLTSGPVAQVDGTDSGNSIASLLLGTGSGGDAPYQTKLSLQQRNFGLYVQDTWQASPRLTLTAGLRWDLQGARTERFNRLNTFNPAIASPLAASAGLPLTGGLVFAGSGNRGLWDTRYSNFDPRLSIAYKITDRLVLRSGYGIFNPNTYSVSGDASLSSDGFSSDTTWNSTVGNGGITPLNLVNNPFPNGLVQPVGSSQGLLTQAGQQVHASLKNHPTPYVQVYSLDFQYQTGNNGVFELGYVGTLGRQLQYGVYTDLNQLPSNYLSMGTAALNRPVNNPFQQVFPSGPLSGSTLPYWRTLVKYPQFSSVQLLAGTPGSSSNFNGLTAKYEQRFREGISLLVTYQYSKAMDDTSENNGWEVKDALRDTFNHSLDYSISAHDITHSFVATNIWELPFGHGKRFGGTLSGFTDAVVGGWKLNTIVRYNSGLPINLTQNNTLGTYNFSVSRPNLTSSKALAQGPRSVDRWFNTSAVVQAGTSAFPVIGNAPRYISNIRYARVGAADMALEKYFPLYERARLQFRAEAYDISNTPAYGQPDINLGDSAFGQISSTKSVGPRQLQFGARIEF